MSEKETGFWNSIRVKNQLIRETIGEFFGTFVLTIIGNAAIAVIVLNGVANSGAVVIPLAWGLGLTFAIFVCGGVSGAHVNPAVTVAFATIGKFPWKKVIPYMLSQYLGAFVAAAILFLVYRDGIEAFDNGIRSVPPNVTATANIFSCFPQTFTSTFTCVIDQIVGTGLLLVAVCSITDERNMNVPKGMAPLMIGLTLCSIMFGFASNCGAPLNPARDLGPRIFTAMAGWGTEVFSVRDYNWFWIPVIGPHIGAIVGVWIYTFAVEAHWPNTSYDLTKDPPSEIQVQSQVQMQSVKVYDTKQ